MDEAAQIEAEARSRQHEFQNYLQERGPTTKPRRPKLTTKQLHRSLVEAMQHSDNLDIYEAYCAGFARAAQYNEVADLVLPFDCARTAAAFCMGVEHVKRVDEVEFN